MGSPSQILSDLFHRALSDGLIQTRQGPLTPSYLKESSDLLKKAGVKPREAIGMCFENGPSCLLFYMSLVELNAIAVPLPPVVPETERRRLWGALGCRWFVNEQGLNRLDPRKDPPIWPERIHWVMHSSGSTGIAKAIPLTLEAMLKNAQDVMRTLGVGTNLLHLGSMSHCYTNGLFNSFLLPLMTGGRVCVGPVVTTFKSSEFIDLIRTFKPEILWVNPVVVACLRRFAKPEDLGSVKALISCTAPLIQNECLMAESSLQRPVLQSYGLTETLIVTVEKPGRDVQTQFSTGISVAGPEAISFQEDSVLVIENGAVFPGYARQEQGQIVLLMPQGKPGQIFVSGDLGRLDDAGHLTIIGRHTQVINVKGVKVSPEQMESLLCEQACVRSVVVVGLPDGRGSEQPIALVVPEKSVDTAALADLCVERLGRYARPVIYLVPQVPLTANGKIDRPAAFRLAMAQRKAF